MPKAVDGIKLCPKCSESKPVAEFSRSAQSPDGLYGHCLPCMRAGVNAAYRKNREKRLAYLKEYRDRESSKAKVLSDYHIGYRRDEVNAQRAVYRALKKGELVRPEACEECGVSCRPDGHHEDYKRRLDVVWLCRWCHARRHAGQPRGAKRAAALGAANG